MRQRMKVLEIIKSEVAATGRWPSARMIADEMGWKNTSGVTDSLDGLVRHGHIRRRSFGGPVMDRYELIDGG